MENLKDKIICSEQDLVGVFFLGTKEKDTQSSFEHVYKFIEMGNPTATGIRSLQVFYCHHFSFCCAILVAFSQHYFEHPSGTFLYLGNSWRRDWFRSRVWIIARQISSAFVSWHLVLRHGVCRKKVLTCHTVKVPARPNAMRVVHACKRWLNCVYTRVDIACHRLQPHDFKSISIFTNDDDPFNGDKQKEEQCVQKAKVSTRCSLRHYEKFLILITPRRTHSHHHHEHHEYISFAHSSWLLGWGGGRPGVPTVEPRQSLR